MDQHAESWVGRTLAERYRIDGALKAGGMGAVYRAVDLNMGDRPVVVKHPLRGVDGGHGSEAEADLRRRFAAEVSKLIALTDVPGVVRIVDQGVEGGTPFYVMDFLVGGSLADRLQSGPEAPGEVLRWAREVAETLDRIHRRGLVHRDIKPANILFQGVGAEARAYVADFGIVKELAAEWGTTGPLNTRIGTPGFMAPEQSLPDATVDGRCDQYALAATLYTALTGRPLIYETTGGSAAPTPGRAGAGRKRLRPVNAPDLAPHVPAAAAAAVAKGLQREPEDRFPTCTGLIEAFEAGLRPAQTTTRTRHVATPAEPLRARARSRVPLVAVVVALVGGGGYLGMKALGFLGGEEQPTATGSATGAAGAPAAEMAWEAVLARALEAKEREDGLAVRKALDGGQLVEAPVGRVQPLLTWLQGWEAKPTLTVTAPQAAAVVEGTADAGFAIPVVGILATRRSADRLFVDGKEVPRDASGAFNTLAIRKEAGPSTVTIEVRAGKELRARLDVPVELRFAVPRAAAWEAPLAEALAAMAKGDGAGAKRKLGEARRLEVPDDRVPPDLVRGLAAYEAAPTLTLDAPESGTGSMDGTVRIAGVLGGARATDQVLVNGRVVALTQGRFETQVEFGSDGRLLVEVSVVDGAERRLTLPPRQYHRARPLPLLLDALRGPDLALRRQAAEEIARLGLGAKPAVGPLRGLLTSRSAETRSLAVATLASIGPAAVPELLAAVATYSDETPGAQRALVAMGPSVVPALIAAFDDEPDEPMGTAQFSPMMALGEIGPQALPLLMDTVERGSLKQASYAAEAIARVLSPWFGEKPPVDPATLRRTVDVARLVRVLLGAMDRGVKPFYPVLSLGFVGEAAAPAVPRLIEMLGTALQVVQGGDGKGTYYLAGVSAVLALQRLGKTASAALPTLHAMAAKLRPGSASSYARVRLAIAHVEGKPWEATEELIDLLAGARQPDRVEILRALQDLERTGTMAAPKLKALLELDSAWTYGGREREGFSYGLGLQAYYAITADEPYYVTRMRALLGSGSSGRADVRTALALGAAPSGRRAAVEYLRAAAQQEANDVEALWRIEDALAQLDPR